MKKIHGKILLKETGEGIANLVIAAFDSEMPWKEILSLRDLRKEGKFDIGKLGKRIGSVLSDREGRFLLNQEDLQFEGVESRPDLILAVFAPEDILDIDDPFPRSAEDRLLYVSVAPRNDAGSEEAFIIRLLRAQLERYGIDVRTSSNQSQSESSSLANAIEKTWSLKDELKDKTKGRARWEMAKTDEIRDRAAKKVAGLSALPLHLRDGKEEKNGMRNNSFLINGKKELPEKLNTLQMEVVDQGLKKMGNAKPTLRLRLNSTDLKELGLKVAKGKITGKVDPKILGAKVQSLMNGVDLIRVKGLNNPSPDELEKKYLKSPVIIPKQKNETTNPK